MYIIYFRQNIHRYVYFIYLYTYVPFHINLARFGTHINRSNITNKKKEERRHKNVQRNIKQETNEKQQQNCYFSDCKNKIPS